MEKSKKTDLEEMRSIAGLTDEETAHYKADDLLCKLVRKHVPDGRRIVNVYNSIPKWYG